MQNQSQEYYTPIQLKMPVDMERLIEVDDPVYSFNEVLRHIDLKKYFVEEEDHKTGRPGYDGEKLLKVILFAFMEEGYQATRKVKKLCRTDIRFLWLLDGEKGPSQYYRYLQTGIYPLPIYNPAAKQSGWGSGSRLSARSSVAVRRPEQSFAEGE